MTKLTMASAADERPPDSHARGRRPPDLAIQQAVLAALGRPPALYGVVVRPLWADHYRVNVLVGPDPTSVRIAHSYFVEAGEAGDLRSTAPRIVRLYT